LAVLPPEYNLRTCFPYFVGGNTTVRILHDREDSLESAQARWQVMRPQLMPQVVAPIRRAALPASSPG
jgi:hypothetical protein